MEELFAEIEQAVLDKLDIRWPEPPKYLEYIQKTKDQEDNPSDWFFVDVVPVSFVTAGPCHTQISVLIDISAYLTSESNKEYRRMALQLDPLFRPVFRLAGRALTIASVETPIVAGVLHYVFKISFIPDVKIEQPGETAGELDFTIN